VLIAFCLICGPASTQRGTADELFEALKMAVAGVFEDPLSDGGSSA